MAVVTVQEQKDRSSTHNVKNERTYSRQWIVETDSATDDAVTVENGWVIVTGISAGTAHPSDAGAIAKEISTSCDSDDGKTWTVTCSYGPWDESEKNPLLQPTDIQWSFNQYEKIVDSDILNDAIVNSAGDPFADPVTIDDSRLVLNVTRNEATFPVSVALAYVNSVNSDSWYGGNPRQWRCSNISATKQYDAEYGAYYQVSYSFDFRVETFDHVILDRGTRELDAGNLRAIYISGSPVTDPVLLDGAGERLPEGDPPHYLTFRCYDELPYSGVFNF